MEANKIIEFSNNAQIASDFGETLSKFMNYIRNTNYLSYFLYSILNIAYIL